MWRLQARSPHASIARNEFADKVVAEQFGTQAGNKRIGQQYCIIKGRSELREYSPARCALPKHRLRDTGNLIPRVPLPASHTIIEHNFKGFPEVFNQLQRKKIAQNNTPRSMKQQCRLAQAIYFQPPGGVLLLGYRQFKVAHRPIQSHIHPLTPSRG